jgi:glycerol-3-phosphate O-acyltransferase/dihydroxyacetone phosphate acyltransferase
MLYYLVRPIARIAILVFFRKIYLSHFDRIPRNKPVILASNHPTGFMEPCIMAVFLRQPLYYLVRGDFFTKTVYNFLLRSLKMIPIYRIVDAGYSGLRNNYATFAACSAGLSQNRTIMIFPEGNARHEKRLRPLQKGLGRIVTGTFENFPEMDELYIVPVGVNYTYAESPRTEVMIDIGEPIKAKPIFEEMGARAGVELTRRLEKAMTDRIVVIDWPEDEGLAEHLLVMDRSERLTGVFPIKSAPSAPIQAEKKIADWVNVLPESEKEPLTAVCAAYFDALNENKVEDWNLVCPNRYGRGAWIRAVVGTLPAWVGRIFCYPPMALALHIRKSRVSRIEFYSPVLLATSMGAFLIYFILWGLIAWIASSGWVFLAALLLGSLGYVSLVNQELWHNLKFQSRFQRLPAETKTRLQALRLQIKNRTHDLR